MALIFCFFHQSNRITKMENLDGLVNLDQLYLSHNGITAIEGLDKLVSIPIILAILILPRSWDVGLSVRTRNSKTIAPIDLIFYTRNIIPMTLSSSKMIRNSRINLRINLRILHHWEMDVKSAL